MQFAAVRPDRYHQVTSLTRSKAIVFSVPLHKFPKAIFDVHPWPAAANRSKFTYVRISNRYVSGLHWQYHTDRLAPCVLLQEINKILKLNGLLIANVVDPVRRPAGVRAICPIRYCGRRRLFHDANNSINNVVYKRKVTFKVPVIE